MPPPDLVSLREVRVAEPSLEPGRVSTTYRFTRRDGSVHEIPLAFRYEGDVWGEDAFWRRLARTAVAVPVVNYALFSEALVLDFPLPRVDLAYLDEMADVTVREQVLNRIVGDDPNIRPEVQVSEEDFDPAMLERRGRLEAGEADLPEVPDLPRGDGVAVLSSGGKESLFSYGVLRELGRDPVPVFVNESGRHWHTAVTSYRHLAATDPRTRRVWTTVDRLYRGANRLIDAVRPDFEHLTADTYPTQLFTFNVYQVATLPVLLREGCGNLVMGNEIDEGPWPQVRGVQHWNGIYDQSQGFDERASRWYREAGWDVGQFSLVRSLASLPIERELARRYPDLLPLQTSCHSTTFQGGVPVPCGRCTKCMGVLLYLLAVGVDPTGLRYRGEDVAAFPERLRTVGVRLDPAEAEHAMHLAREGGLDLGPTPEGYRPRAHPWVERMRFDPEMSHEANLPPDLAREVYPMLHRLAGGALERDPGGGWRELPLAELLERAGVP